MMTERTKLIRFLKNLITGEYVISTSNIKRDIYGYEDCSYSDEEKAMLSPIQKMYLLDAFKIVCLKKSQLLSNSDAVNVSYLTNFDAVDGKARLKYEGTIISADSYDELLKKIKNDYNIDQEILDGVVALLLLKLNINILDKRRTNNG